jgi:hypothetical protein
MRAAQLRLLRVPPFQLVSDSVEELDIALLGIFCQRSDESLINVSSSLEMWKVAVLT